ncbi:acyl carrier protein [Micromonospora echinospora]|uniref:acyl carrier protein n=1 Tax=Micromonospora echinospora TaxID=1877 RepID=UPI0037917671
MSGQTSDVIHEFLARRFPQREIGTSDDIFAQGFVNSLFAMELVMFIERTFGVTIPNDLLRLDNFRSVAAMTDLLEKKLAVRG